MIVTFGEWLLARGSGLARVPVAAEREDGKTIVKCGRCPHQWTMDLPPAGARGPWTQEFSAILRNGDACGWDTARPVVGAVVPAPTERDGMSTVVRVESRWVSAPVKEGGR